jgi:subtilisin family serine protease
VNVWNVDIISMSFGYPTDRPEGYDQLNGALLHAYSNKVLVFAAASNDGANTDRAHPARNQNVICVHSTDAKGNRSRFSPTALTDDKNLATIGQAVESAWPRHLCNATTNPTWMEWKSGTSYSTPIAVGIATFLLQYGRLYLPDKADQLKIQMKMKNVLVRIAQKEQSFERRDGYNYVALSRHPDTFFGKSKAWIDETLAGLL